MVRDPVGYDAYPEESGNMLARTMKIGGNRCSTTKKLQDADGCTGVCDKGDDGETKDYKMLMVVPAYATKATMARQTTKPACRLQVFLRSALSSFQLHHGNENGDLDLDIWNNIFVSLPGMIFYFCKVTVML